MSRPIIRQLTPVSATATTATFADPQTGAPVTLGKAAETGEVLSAHYHTTELALDGSYQDGGDIVRTWRAAGITVVTRGDGDGVTGTVATT